MHQIFEQGVESLVVLQVKPDTDPRRVQEGFDALSSLVEELDMLVVQHTSGPLLGLWNTRVQCHSLNGIE